MASAGPNLRLKRTKLKRGRNQIKIKIFKMIAKSLKHLATRVAGKTMKTAGDGGGVCGCFSSPATITPLEATGEVKAGSKLREFMQTQPRKMGVFLPVEVPEFGGGKGAAVVEVDGRSFLPEY